MNYPLPNCLEKAASRMYADDTNISSAASDLNVRGRERDEERIKKNKNLAPGEQVSLNVAKTKFILICTRQTLRLQGSKQCKYKSKSKGKILTKLRKLTHWMFL